MKAKVRGRLTVFFRQPLCDPCQDRLERSALRGMTQYGSERAVGFGYDAMGRLDGEDRGKVRENERVVFEFW